MVFDQLREEQDKMGPLQSLKNAVSRSVLHNQSENKCSYPSLDSSALMVAPAEPTTGY